MFSCNSTNGMTLVSLHLKYENHKIEERRWFITSKLL